MIGLFRLSCSTLGTVALMILAGCGGQPQQPAEPQTLESMPPGETGESGQQGEQPGAQAEPGAQAGQGMMGHEQMGQPQGQPGMGAGAQGAPPGAQPAAPPSPQGDATEVQICAEIQQNATVRVENIANGAVLIMTPKSGSDLASVRQTAQRVEARMRPADQGGVQPAPQGAAMCALFDVGRVGARATIQETPTSIRLLLTAPDRPSVEQVRRHAREFAATTAGGTNGQDRTRQPR